ncbi:MAG: hypothetical protein AAF719_13340 [Pseudomonadota bacterium]
MKVETVSFAHSVYDRRSYNKDTRGQGEKRERRQDRRRARNTTTPWVNAAFGAQIIGQATASQTSMDANRAEDVYAAQANIARTPRTLRRA